MSSGSNRHSALPGRPVDPSIVRVLRAVDEIASALNCPFFVAGATARDLILVNVFGLHPGRATHDIDLGIAVESWDQFRVIKDRLIATGTFNTDSRAQQRVVYTDAGAGFSVPVDLIPFRGVASPTGTVAWPPTRDIVLNVAGFEDAWAAALQIEIEQDLVVRVASIPGLTVLKLIASADRGSVNNKDAADLHRFFTSYADAASVDRLYEEEADLLEATAFDLELAGAQLLGMDCAPVCKPATFEQIRSVLTTERHRERLTTQMTQTSAHDDVQETTNRVVDSFCQGFLR
jgi:predicted nucleotidyltransferase